MPQATGQRTNANEGFLVLVIEGGGRRLHSTSNKNQRKWCKTQNKAGFRGQIKQTTAVHFRLRTYQYPGERCAPRLCRWGSLHLLPSLPRENSRLRNLLSGWAQSLGYTPSAFHTQPFHVQPVLRVKILRRFDVAGQLARIFGRHVCMIHMYDKE